MTPVMLGYLIAADPAQEARARAAFAELATREGFHLHAVFTDPDRTSRATGLEQLITTARTVGASVVVITSRRDLSVDPDRARQLVERIERDAHVQVWTPDSRRPPAATLAVGYARGTPGLGSVLDLRLRLVAAVRGLTLAEACIDGPTPPDRALARIRALLASRQVRDLVLLARYDIPNGLDTDLRRDLGVRIHVAGDRIGGRAPHQHHPSHPT